MKRKCTSKSAIFLEPERSRLIGAASLGEPHKRANWFTLPDVLADREYTWGEAQKIGGYRAALGVPLLREGNVAGVLFIAKTVPQPFTGKQIELATTFADQAVIAIENTRLFGELQNRTDDLTESLQQQTATSDVLRVISRSPTNIQPVLDAILETAGRLCESEYALFFRLHDGKYHLAGSNNAKADYIKYLSEHPISVDRGTVVGRTAVERRVVHIPDCLADPEYTAHEYARTGKHRSMLGVPLLRDGEPIGVIGLLRTSVRPYTDKQIELVTTFADQAVIAIENVRLFDEVQTRTRDLSESLQQQTATAEVLKVLSRSTFDLQTVLDTLAESVARLCEAYDSIIMLRNGEQLRVRAHHGPIPADFTEWPIGRGWVTGRAFVDRVPIHIHDLQEAVHEFPDGGEMAHRLGHRTILAVPLLREGEAVGVLVIRRTEVKPFTDKQIELVETFADQAVIAIENVRLFDEVQSRTRDLSELLQQQTATAEVLKVISASPGELEAGIQRDARKCHPHMRGRNSVCCSVMKTVHFILQRLQWAFRRCLLISTEQRGVFQPPAGSPLDRLLQVGSAVYTADEAAEPSPGSPASLVVRGLLSQYQC